ncbi:hypothetical protein CANTEDRAFT_116710 [Yamadazyma tenuis ATCC 10573]|uniref:Uncharacterized protein n=1 Tax=Candida tenuis (strain ATCC 10573 / BCRC 21748 / CBS 615 / JCM 9827 / NBRC 10315 / NRRL Y-1498 / VKM Y-70) TaxID=590646 RepID=G3BF64_CANTC|nr:uncharacterized protein CANTEDRAFT_116710 [Yamadazyma tenuis ATCC 10573]EGV60650.1 hypothetical protein CANTEDRAFT_116710 [Yamadazyma tenuis ATCC 10573]
MSQLQSQMEGLPGYDILMGFWEDYAGEHLNTIDPYEDENGNKRRLPSSSSQQEQRMWKIVQKKAWAHDKCFLGSCGVGMDCGVGLAPLVVLFFPVLGPLIMYGVHARLIHVVTNEMKLPGSLVAKMEANIVVDLLITFPPVIGCFFGYLHSCSTRNAGLIYKYFLFLAEQREKNNVPLYVGRGAIGHGPETVQPAYAGTARQNNYQNPNSVSKKPMFGQRTYSSGQRGKPSAQISVDQHQQSGFL